MGTTCNLGWRESDDKERLWILDHNHPIMKGITDRYIELEAEETYMEPFGIPDPDKLLMIGWYNGGEVFRSACCWRRENGKIFYFQPGHESYPTFYKEPIQTIITNAVRWTAPTYRSDKLECPWMPRIEK
jgi:trehalose utilization protein